MSHVCVERGTDAPALWLCAGLTHSKLYAPPPSRMILTSQPLNTQASGAILFFLSMGYFVSRNSLREIRASLSKQKTIVLVHEQREEVGHREIRGVRRFKVLALRRTTRGRSARTLSVPSHSAADDAPGGAMRLAP